MNLLTKKKLLTIPIAAVACLVGLVMKSKFGGDWYEFLGFVTGVVGVYLVAIEHIANWPIGLVNVATYGYVFYNSRLYADMSLQVFFFALGVMGWYAWLHGGNNKTELQITSIKKIQWLWLVLALVIGTAIYYPIIHHFNGAAPFVDSMLTVTSILAQLLLNFKRLENWILWIFVDIVYIPLYISRQLYSTAILYAIFLVIAISGLISWRTTYKELNAECSA
ncbi:MAG: nicotinamide mononucleotide transporter PnuC [Armatimonadetes bacterium Cent15-Ar3]|nr:MAG: nicotinamide mononucleotide transporter PnuC [Armatimonadetes bacterium Cent15-Ar3]